MEYYYGFGIHSTIEGILGWRMAGMQCKQIFRVDAVNGHLLMFIITEVELELLEHNDTLSSMCMTYHVCWASMPAL